MCGVKDSYECEFDDFKEFLSKVILSTEEFTEVCGNTPTFVYDEENFIKPKSLKSKETLELLVKPLKENQ